ncbi:MAG: hypothetical protein LBG27_02420 [Spirochaetaceae bacterium]|nr:hypothetical protein [Spirochaetaceae bacterium]
MRQGNIAAIAGSRSGTSSKLERFSGISLCGDSPRRREDSPRSKMAAGEACPPQRE